jgi:hypothetical protein
MFKKINENSTTSSNTPILPDPWLIPEPGPQFPSPLELDRLLRDTRPAIGAAHTYPEIAPAGVPGALGLPAHAQNTGLSSATVLLQDELKLSTTAIDDLETPLETALALLFWLNTA